MSINFDVTELSQNKKLARATLDSPKSLNALTLPMIQGLLEKLEQWQNDDSVVAVMIDSSAAKAFCAGGDIKNLYYGIKENHFEPLEEFFAQEYYLNYRLHTYAKPVIAWGQGLIMGGGMGVFCACSHRIVGHSVKMAMPEMRIGFFPDVGASYFLNNMAVEAGLFAGLTAVFMSQQDAILHNLADYALAKPADGDGNGNEDGNDEDKAKAKLISELQKADFSSDKKTGVSDNHQRIHEICQRLSVKETDFSDNPFLQNAIFMKDFATSGSAAQALKKLDKAAENNAWLDGIRQRMKGMSPFSQAVFFEQLKRSRHLSLKEIFNFERDIAYQMIRFPDLAEGVRALLIDKDQQPDWTFKNIADVRDADVADIFVSQESRRPYLI